MWVQVVPDAHAPDNRCCSPLNGGTAHPSRLQPAWVCLTRRARRGAWAAASTGRRARCLTIPRRRRPMCTESGSVIHRDRRPTNDAACMALARRSGALMLGKSVTPEFAYFSLGPTVNPANLARTPGGSSSAPGIFLRGGGLQGPPRRTQSGRQPVVCASVRCAGHDRPACAGYAMAALGPVGHPGLSVRPDSVPGRPKTLHDDPLGRIQATSVMKGPRCQC
ncbi:MAG: hypothetical protein RIS90_2510 [Pseudomonadota bacterium]